MRRNLAIFTGLMALGASPVLAQEASADVQYIFNTLLFLIGGFLVMFMAAGFAMLEAGLVRSKNVTTQLTKNIGLFSIAAIAYWLIGYNLMYPSEWTIELYVGELFSPKVVNAGASVDDGYSSGSDFIFQLMFCAATASIVSGALAERIKIWPFFIFSFLLTAIIYPIAAGWQWGGGFLSEAGFSDFAGSTVVHSVGGWAALAGAIILGPRIGKYSKDGRPQPLMGSSMPLATLGTFILWLGWFGFNGGSQLAMGTIEDADAVSIIFANTNTAAAAGALAAIILTQLVYGKIDLTMALNGALAGLVSITAEPLTPSLGAAAAIGAVGGIIVVFAVPMLDRMKIDDVVGAIPVHLIAGIWGTLAVPLTNDGTNFGSQIMGILSVGIFTFVVSLVVWVILKAVVGIRVGEEEEINGLDSSELGMEAYPDFMKSAS